MDLKLVKDSFCQILISSLILRICRMLLCDYQMVIDYILEINRTKRQNIKNGFIHFLLSYLIQIDVGNTKSSDVSNEQNSLTFLLFAMAIGHCKQTH